MVAPVAILTLLNTLLKTRVARRLRTATGTALAISCKQVFYSPSLPVIVPGFRAQKNRNVSGVRFCQPVGVLKLHVGKHSHVS